MCIQCQKAIGYISIRIDSFKSALDTFSIAERFYHIHADIVGPLRVSLQDYRYLVNIVDRHTGWPEAFLV